MWHRVCILSDRFTNLEEAPLRNGNPSPGKFVNKSDEITAAMYYEFNKADLPFTTEDMEGSAVSGCVIIAFHAVIGDETVWSAGSEFSDKNWATYTDFCLN